MNSLERYTQYSQPITELYQQIIVNDLRQFDCEGLVLTNGWQAVGTTDDPYKLKALNPALGLFVKLYSPITNGYPERAYNAIQELSELELSMPILPPLSLCNGSLIFQMGEVGGRKRYQEVFQPEEQEIIRAVLEKYSLKPHAKNAWVEFVSVNKHVFMIDPFDDNSNEIFEYIDPKE